MKKDAQTGRLHFSLQEYRYFASANNFLILAM